MTPTSRFTYVTRGSLELKEQQQLRLSTSHISAKRRVNEDDGEIDSELTEMTRSMMMMTLSTRSVVAADSGCVIEKTT